jgi:Photosystem II Pbs27
MRTHSVLIMRVGRACKHRWHPDPPAWRPPPPTPPLTQDASKLVSHMRYCTSMEKGASNIEAIATNCRREMTDFVSYYRRFPNTSGKLSYSNLYTSINVLAGHYASCELLAALCDGHNGCVAHVGLACTSPASSPPVRVTVRVLRVAIVACSRCCRASALQYSGRRWRLTHMRICAHHSRAAMPLAKLTSAHCFAMCDAHTADGPKFPVPEKRRKRLLVEYDAIDKVRRLL